MISLNGHLGDTMSQKKTGGNFPVIAFFAALGLATVLGAPLASIGGAVAIPAIAGYGIGHMLDSGELKSAAGRIAAAGIALAVLATMARGAFLGAGLLVQATVVIGLGGLALWPAYRVFRPATLPARPQPASRPTP
ncbi:MAG: hypothetical protein AAB833_00415 [Patescibacteria group bacterium]